MKDAFDATLINSINQEILFLKNDEVLNSQGQTLAHFEGNNLMNQINQKIGSIDDGQILNIQGQVLGSVKGDNLINLNGQKIMKVKGATHENRTKVAAYFFFMS